MIWGLTPGRSDQVAKVALNIQILLLSIGSKFMLRHL